MSYGATIMPAIKKLSLILIAISVLFTTFCGWAKPLLTAEEKQYISRKKTVIVGVVNDNEPYSFFRDGAEKGFSVDFLRMLEKESGLRFEIRMGNWTDIYNAFLSGKIDVIDEISYTEERARIVSFTEPYHFRKTVFFKRGDDNRFSGLSVESLKGRKIGIAKDIYYLPILREAGIELTEYNNYADLMKSLAFGWTDAVVASELTGKFIARENSLPNIVSVGNAGLDKLHQEDFRLGILKQSDPLLFSVINKSLKSIPRSSVSDLEQMWETFSGRDIAKPEKIKLTHEEEAYIKSHPAVSVGTMPDYSPFSFVSGGNVSGYTRSLLDIISKQTGITFLYSPNNWPELIKSFKKGRLDIMADMSYTEDRANYTLFTSPYYQIPNVVFVRDDFGGYNGLNSIRDKRVGVMSDIFYMDKLKTMLKSPPKEYVSQDDMLRDLAFGRLDAAVTALNAGNNIIKKYALVNLRIAGSFTPEGVGMEDLRFGVTKQHPKLHSIMEKALKSITPEEHIQLENQWITAKVPEVSTGRNLFNPEELAYLKKKKVIYMCVDPDWIPFEKLKNGNTHIGISADFFELIRPKLPAEITIVPTTTWEESLLAVNSRKCDIVSLAMKTDDRRKYLNFTSPYLVVPNVVATSVNEPFISGIESVLDKTFGSVKGYAITEVLRRNYPSLKIIEVTNDEEGIRMLQQGRIYGYIGTMASIGYQISQQKITDIKISARLPQDWELGVGTRNDEPILGSIFQKLVLSVSPAERNEILGRWLSVRYDQKFNYDLFSKILAVVALFLVVMMYWGNKLRKLNTQLQEANQRLQELSEKDSLTGLYNRRYFSANAMQVFGMCRRSGIRFSIAILDIDHFKRINDTYGHVTGDLCLQRIAHTIKQHFLRENDTSARYGGEEFAVYTTGGDENALASYLERLRHDIETICVDNEGDCIRMTISSGVYSLIPDNRDTLDDAVRKADDALYKAKQNGRNRVEIYTED